MHLITRDVSPASGRIPQAYVDAATAFGDAIRKTFRSPLGEIHDVTVECNVPVTVVLTSSVVVDTVETREDLGLGQTIARYAIDALIDHKWVNQKAVNGQTVGNRVVDILPEPVLASAIRFRCLDAVREMIHIRSIKVFKAEPPVA